LSAQADRAAAFRALHLGKKPLILPNAWDVPSARVFEEAGFPAVATSSAGMVVSLGYPDGESIGRTEYLAATQRIVRAVSIPASADIVSGFGRTPREVATTVRRVLAAGAVGINLEDGKPSGRGLFPEIAQVRKIEAIQRVGESMGIPLVINARTDALRRGRGSDAARMEEAIHRSAAYRDAGADCVYPMGLTEARSIRTFVRALRCPVNVMVRKGLPTIAELARLGVRRVSFGPSASYAALGLLERASREVRSRGTYRTLLEGAISFDELNRLALPRARAG
jgi:2-methylisocitrate lyase-like PEP mutase family enzyme